MFYLHCNWHQLKNTIKMTQLQPCPLDEYRKQSSFGISDIQSHFDDEQCLSLQRKIWETLEKDPLFKSSDEEISGEMELDKYRHLTHLRAKRICQHQFVTIDMMLQNPLFGSVFNNAVGMFNWDCITRYVLHLTVRSVLFIIIHCMISLKGLVALNTKKL